MRTSSIFEGRSRGPVYLAILLALLCLAYPASAKLATGGQIAGAQAQEMAQIGATDIAQFRPSIDVYFADSDANPGAVFYARYANSAGTPFYTRPSGRLHSFTFHPGIPEKLYFVNANENKIYLVAYTGSGWSSEQVVYTHNTYVRDIAFAKDSAGDVRIYFSEATGAGANGKIYRLETDGTATQFYEVRLSNVGGYWGGDFAFDTDGNLLLSSGNHIPATIYKVRDGSGAISQIFTDRTRSIEGMAVKGGMIYYANGQTRIYKLDPSTAARSDFHTDSSATGICDVGFKGPIGADDMPRAGTYYLRLVAGNMMITPFSQAS
ncbi:MAG: hypothetical protein JW986_08540 [Methanotrichaceae archaeon]|nr:hypothetical protein [Methanotrichaceae archaeon]